MRVKYNPFHSSFIHVHQVKKQNKPPNLSLSRPWKTTMIYHSRHMLIIFSEETLRTLKFEDRHRIGSWFDGTAWQHLSELKVGEISSQNQEKEASEVIGLRLRRTWMVNARDEKEKVKTRHVCSLNSPWTKKVRMNFPLRKWMKTDRALGWEPNYLNEFKFIYGGLFVTTLTCIQFPVVVNQ